MEPRKDESKKPSEAQNQVKKPRFRIEQLEERIAPHHCRGRSLRHICPR
jgi:hypothetical protein